MTHINYIGSFVKYLVNLVEKVIRMSPEGCRTCAREYKQL